MQPLITTTPCSSLFTRRLLKCHTTSVIWQLNDYRIDTVICIVGQELVNRFKKPASTAKQRLNHHEFIIAAVVMTSLSASACDI